MGIGDELMAAGEARAHFRRTGHPVKILRGGFNVKWFDVWNGLPYILRMEDPRFFDVIVAKGAKGFRPYIAAKTPECWTWRAYAPQPAEIAFTDDERAFGAAADGAVIVEPHLKSGASPNKQWGWTRWQRLVGLRADLDWVQLGPPGLPALEGVRRIETGSFREAAAALAAARAAVLPEGALHHAAAAVGTPAVVIFGGYIAPAVTGYAGQRSLFAGEGLGCGMRVRCQHCAVAMAAIAPERVAQELGGLLEENRRSVAA